MSHLPYNCHLHSQWARLRHTKVACQHSCIVRTCVDPRLDDLCVCLFTAFYRNCRKISMTPLQWYIKTKCQSCQSAYTFPSEEGCAPHWCPTSSPSGLDRRAQQGELRSSAMSGGTDRREDEQVPQFYGRVDENFAEWETDVAGSGRLSSKWKTVDRFGSRLYRRGLHFTAENHCGNKAQEYKMLHNSQWLTSLNASKTTGMENSLKSLDKRHWIHFFDMRRRQGCAHSGLHFP